MLELARTLGTIAISTALALPCLATERPTHLRFCYENEDVYPWVLRERPGLNIVLMQMLAQRTGVRLELLARPWKRCQEELRTGAIDGMFAASFKLDRMELGVYPMAGDKPDESKAVMVDGYTLYRLRGSKVQWDGKKLSVTGPVGAQPGYSIIDQLQALGARVDDGTRSADDNLRKLLAGRVEAVALQTLEGDNSVRSQPEFAAKVEAVQPVLVSKPFYLMLSKQLVATYPEFSRELWNGVATIRDSAAFKAQAATFR